GLGAALAGLGLLTNNVASAGGSAAAADRQVTGERHLEPAATDLNDDGLPRQGVLFLDRITTGERLDGVVPLCFDPPGVDGEAVAVPDERGVGHDRAVERDHGGQALDIEFVQRAA